MKNLLFFFLIFLSTQVYAQKVITNPGFGATNVSGLTIDKILLSKSETLFYFTANFPPGGWFLIAPETYLLEGGSSNKIIVKSATKITLGKKDTLDKTGKKSFTLTFPALSAGTSSIDFIETDCEGCFKILDIQLNSE